MPVPVLTLDLLQTLTLAAVVYYAGVLLRRRIPVLTRLNIPSAVVGGLLFAAVVFVCRDRFLNLQLATMGQPLLMVAFFTTIGMGASAALLRSGGLGVAVFVVFATIVCVAQNLLGMGVASALGENPLMGVMAGSVTLMGGPATGLAFAPEFTKAGLQGADVLAITAAVFGIVCGGLAGGPVGTWLIHRHRLKAAPGPGAPADAGAATGTVRELVVHIEQEDTAIIRNLAVLALAMGIGSIVSRYIQATGFTLPAYIGAMIIACGLRNLDDSTGWLRIDEHAMEFIGGIALNIFLVVALMDLRIWELAGQALPLFVILAVQLAFLLALAIFVSYRLMGRDYDSAVMAGGFVGFAMGTTANAVANMRTLAGRFGPAPRAFLIVPLVGAFFIDFINALVITGFVNWLR
ncbi:MAG: sodium/glutamate symporter [Chromatiales bacterium]|nr:sodium/glutamate symporter [Chromatiales bacterium]